jgi:hypothetical protein
VALGAVGIEEAVRRHALDHLRQLPSKVHRILHAGLEALPAIRGMDMRGVARDQHASRAVVRRLTRSIGEPGNRGGRVNPIIGSVDGDERRAEIAECG